MVMRWLDQTERAGRFLDRLAIEKIVLAGIVTILCTGFILWGFIFVPLKQQAAAARETKLVLQQQLDSLVTKQTEDTHALLNNSDLPEALEFLRTCIQTEGVTVDGINITQFPAEAGGLYQAAVNITLSGEPGKILETLTEIQNQKRVPLLVQELDVNNKKAEITLNILLAGT